MDKDTNLIAAFNEPDNLLFHSKGLNIVNILKNILIVCFPDSYLTKQRYLVHRITARPRHASKYSTVDDPVLRFYFWCNCDKI